MADLGTCPGDLDGEDIVVNRKVASRHFYIHQDHIVAYVHSFTRLLAAQVGHKKGADDYIAELLERERGLLPPGFS